MPKHRIHLDDFRAPPGDRECYEACWSFGRACRTCYHDECYRRGWVKAQVDRDNARLVAEETAKHDDRR